MSRAHGAEHRGAVWGVEASFGAPRSVDLVVMPDPGLSVEAVERTNPEGDALTFTRDSGGLWVTCTTRRDEVTVGPFPEEALAQMLTQLGTSAAPRWRRGDVRPVCGRGMDPRPEGSSRPRGALTHGQ